MKVIRFLSGFIFFLFLIAGCKDSGTPYEEQPPPDYFQLYSGNKMNFSLDSLAGSGYMPVGSSVTVVGGRVTKNGTPYFETKDSVTVPPSGSGAVRYLRSTDAGVYMYVDTNGFSFPLPDSLKKLLRIDREMIVLSYPLIAGREWPVFKVTVGGIDLLAYTATCRGTDTMSYATRGSVNTVIIQKVEYKMKFNSASLPVPFVIPDQAGIAFFAEGLGLMRVEGDAGIVSIFGAAAPSQTAKYLFQRK